MSDFLVYDQTRALDIAVFFQRQTASVIVTHSLDLPTAWLIKIHHFATILEKLTWSMNHQQAASNVWIKLTVVIFKFVLSCKSLQIHLADKQQLP